MNEDKEMVPVWQLEAAKREIERLMKERDGLRETVAGNVREVFVEKMNYEPGAMEMYLQHPMFGLFAASIAEMFTSIGAENYLETRIWCNDIGFVNVTCQKETGKSPHQLRKEAEARAERAEKDRDDYCLLAQINNSKQIEAEGRELEWKTRMEKAEARAERAGAELSKEKESMVQKAMELLSSCSCDKHTAVSFSEFYDAEKAAGCAQCQKERAEKAEADAKRLAAELELEQNPGYTCEALRVHYALVAAHDAGKDAE